MNATRQRPKEETSLQCGLVVANAAPGAHVTLTNVDDRYAEMHGYKREELVGKPLDIVLAPEYREQLPDIIQTINQAGHRTIELMHVRKDGSGFPVRSEILAVRNDGGDVVYYAASVQELENGHAQTEIPEQQTDYEAGRRHGRYRLTDRELTVLRHVAGGKTDKEIAKSLGRSPYTVHNHVRHILLKMGANSRTDATVRAMREGLV
jgi:PAS domain S-box-containing protein